MGKTLGWRDAITVGLAGLAVGGAGALRSRAFAEEAAVTTARKDGAAEALARAIDAHLDQRIAKAGIAVSPPADDAEFLRRASIDLIGAPPSPDEVMTFLADASPAKRDAKVDELLARPEAVRHLAEVWTDIAENDAKGIEGRKEAKIRYGIRDFFHTELSKDTPFDELVRKLLTAEGYLEDNGAAGYFMAYQFDAKSLTATTARTFMGLQIECAQCHDHPFASWKQEEFMGMAAFFARTRQMREPMMMEEKKDAKDEKGKEKPKQPQKQPKLGVQEGERGELVLDEKNNPLTMEDVRKLLKDTNRADLRKMARGGGAAALPGKRVVAPAFIVSTVGSTGDASKTRRESLARMITDVKNPYFRPAVANKVWGILTGRLIVNLADDFSDKSAIKDKDLLAILGKGFLDVKYQMKELVRAIAKTKAYGRSSRGAANDEAEACYAKSIVRPIDGRPLARTLVSGLFLGEQGLDQGRETTQGPGRKLVEEQLLVRFEALFGETNLDPRKYEESIPQALKIMNGGPMQNAGAKKGGGRDLPLVGPSAQAALGRLLSKWEDPRERVTRIYLASLCRPPRKPELDTALKFIESAGKGADAYEDLLWALVNSSEFRFNR